MLNSVSDLAGPAGLRATICAKRRDMHEKLRLSGQAISHLHNLDEHEQAKNKGLETVLTKPVVTRRQ